jgi:2-oxoglutarate ferredoxin oxidoreductase subunit beta
MVATATEPRRDKLNLVGLEKGDYRGRPSTLCSGCGHDSISSQIISVAWELSLPPHQVIKMSGIGCSSKSPAYFLNRSHGFNALHGRMPSVVTGASIANRSLVPIAVSGDGDTGSIGIGQYKHLLRRNVPMVYIIENNGVYGLTKGQFSATADMGQKLKYAGVNELPPIDLCLEAIAADCGFVARSFSGDAKQVRELLKAAISFNGTAVIDIISPCVTFNNHEESTKSYPYGKANEEPLHDITFVPKYEEITVDYAEGEEIMVQMHEGPAIRLKKIDREYNPRDKFEAIKLLLDAQANQNFVTGLIYFDEKRGTIQDVMALDDMPLVDMPESRVRPSRELLDKLMADLA